MAPPPRSIRFPLACVAAYAGAVVGYLPLLTLLLPIEVAAIAGERRYAVLALVNAVGAVAAGGGNVLFGWLSDRSRRRGGGRRRWIAGGLAGTLISFALLPLARSPAALVAAIAMFQLALNAVLAPLMALVAEEVPDRQIGLTTGAFVAGPPLASLLTLAFAVPALAGEGARLALVGAVMTACLLPLLRSRPRSPGAGVRPPLPAPIARRDLAVAWSARLLIQVAGNVVFVDLVYLLSDGAVAMVRLGSLLILVNVAPLPVAVMLGRRLDRRPRQRRRALVLLAAAAALGLGVMAATADRDGRAAGLLLFSIGWSAFLALQVGYIIRLLPDPAHRGRDLGVVNLANTLPLLIGQGLTALIATPRHPEPLLATLAALTLAGGLAMLAVRAPSAGGEKAGDGQAAR